MFKIFVSVSVAIVVCLLSLTAAYDRSDYVCSWYHSRLVNFHIKAHLPRDELNSYGIAEACCICRTRPGNFKKHENGYSIADSYYQTFECYPSSDYCAYTTRKAPPTTPTTTTESKLEKCRHPTGQDCSWYSECLDRFDGCKGTSDEYALTYGKHYCEKYQQNYGKFSTAGKKFIDSTRRCLQEKLSKFIGSGSSCSALKKKAFDSHPSCYTENGFCPLILTQDIWLILNTIGDSFFKEFAEAASNGVATAGKCATRIAQGLLDLSIRRPAIDEKTGLPIFPDDTWMGIGYRR